MLRKTYFTSIHVTSTFSLSFSFSKTASTKQPREIKVCVNKNSLLPHQTATDEDNIWELGEKEKKSSPSLVYFMFNVLRYKLWSG